MKIAEFDYQLPRESIAQVPVEPRDHSRLMIVGRTHHSLEHYYFYQLPDLLNPGDVLVFNNSRVIPARLHGMKKDSHASVELLLLRRLNVNIWETLVRPGNKISAGDVIIVTGQSAGTHKQMFIDVLEKKDNGIGVVRLSDEQLVESLGNVPLPPYIHTRLQTPERYQTVYAAVKGSVAAPTAGLHFTPELLDKLQKKGVQFAFVTLHIGLDTFRPIRVDDPARHPIHTEYGEITEETAAFLTEHKKAGNRIVAVGTSTVRLIEAASSNGLVQPFRNWVNLFIMPGYRFHITNAMITNFHLPRSTLLLLVSAFGGKELIFQAYEQAKKLSYRFYSFGDCMFIQ